MLGFREGGGFLWQRFPFCSEFVWHNTEFQSVTGASSPKICQQACLAGLTFQRDVQLDVRYSCKAKQDPVLILLFFLPWLELFLDCCINHRPVIKYQGGLGLSDAALERSNLILAKTAPGKGDSTETYCISSQPPLCLFFFLLCSESQLVPRPRCCACCILQPGIVPWRFDIPGSDQTGASGPCLLSVPVVLLPCSA